MVEAAGGFVAATAATQSILAAQSAAASQNAEAVRDARRPLSAEELDARLRDRAQTRRPILETDDSTAQSRAVDTDLAAPQRPEEQRPANDDGASDRRGRRSNADVAALAPDSAAFQTQRIAQEVLPPVTPATDNPQAARAAVESASLGAGANATGLAARAYEAALDLTVTFLGPTRPVDVLV